MKAAVLHDQRDIRYDEIVVPDIKEDEILVKVKATGICGSDIPRVLGSAAHYYPIVLGHEFSGEVVEVGSQVTNVKAGDRISGAPLIPCHKCIDCTRGHFSQCKHYSFIGSRVDGSWAEYVKMPGINAIKLPEKVSFVQGAFFEPTTVALHGLFVMDFRGGYDTAIVGMGTIGLLTLQCARILGARRIFAFDIDNKRLDIARDYGADVCINTGDDDFREKVNELTRGRGFDMVIETAGVEFTEKLCLEIAANKGNVMFIGTPSRPITLQPREFEHINRKELTVRGSWMSYSAPFPGREWELAGCYFAKGLIRIEELIDRIVPLEDAAEVFKDFEVPGKVKGKILFEV
ncbi:MAG: galactitol-1-phosphate 5-dehydrogenase [Clostridiales bacterium]|jgi:L-iditol 2-dehydrogenase|nr:galactitol-1-phosphate 5-dehydrogenase [Clostridiales bacterium]